MFLFTNLADLADFFLNPLIDYLKLQRSNMFIASIELSIKAPAERYSFVINTNMSPRWGS
jgi:hypothetical protein